MDAPSTGWVTALAGLLARGSLLSCVRPSQLPSGLNRRELAAHSYGGSHGLLQMVQIPRSLFRPRVLPRGTSTLKCSSRQIGKSSGASGYSGNNPLPRLCLCKIYSRPRTNRRSRIVFSCVMAIRRIVDANTAPSRKGPAMNMTLALRRLGILAAAALLATAIGMKPLTVYAMGTDNPPPPTDDGLSVPMA